MLFSKSGDNSIIKKFLNLYNKKQKEKEVKNLKPDNNITEIYQNYIYWISWIGIILLYVVIRINLVNIPLDRDEGLFGYVGQSILNNGIPYRDVFDHKPPLVFYINALALLFVPPTPSGIHIFLHVYNFLTLVSLSYLAKTYFQSASAGLWTAFGYAIFSASPALQGFTASTEMFMLLPITLSLLLAVLAARKQNILFVISSGIAGALACWIKQSAVFSILFVVIYLISAQMSLNVRQRKNVFENVVKTLIAWSSGIIGISLIIVAYFFLKGVFDEFIYWSFTHNLLYVRKVTFSYTLGEILDQLKGILKGNFILFGIGIFSGLKSILKRDNRGYFVLGFIGFSFFGTIPGYAYRHYFAQLAPAVAVAAGFGFSCLINTMPRKSCKLAVTLFCALLVIFVPLVADSGFYFEESPNKISRDFFGYNPFPESLVLAEYMCLRTSPSDRIFILGSEPQILFYSRRGSSISYPIIYPLTSAFPRNKEFQDKAWEEINNNFPRYILFVPILTSILWDGEADLLIFRKTDQLLERDYFLEAVMTIEGERGNLIVLTEGKNLQIKQPVVLIFRKK